MSDMDFAALLCSRLCHDLVSPVGAIANGIEILQDEHDEEMRVQVIDLLQKSAQQTSNKLQFFRLAFGAAGGFSAELDIREAQSALVSFLSGTRVDLDWQVALTSASKQKVKLLLNLCLMGAETLIRGGTMKVEMDNNDGSTEIVLSVTAERIILQDIVRKTLLGKVAEADLEPRSAPAYLAASVAKEMGGAINIEDGDNSLVIRATGL
ncbi:histidine phosphotransferase [Kordiimonas sediminis]|uniref:Histidine phosphotransferase n=1 Tax=Kordiimonas sediminis TaxID=1735581 RepID=A0A919ASZ0_9PROT|nr:histidine phosphotransferase family protein [Kordiimonas sediminis]GHF22482.1 histidine phosphotransferase [Kordiimonas sediminis]